MRDVSDMLQVAWVGIDEIAETPDPCNSRVIYDEAAIEELAASIRAHGILQPIVVRPLLEPEGDRAPGPGKGPTAPPSYVVIAGNRRLRAARRVGMTEIPCVIRITDANRAFVLNVVENVQRRELSGRERVRAIRLLASLTDRNGRPLGVREIGRLTGLSPATISLWLRIDRRPSLMAALEAKRLDIGRAMLLVPAPDEELDGLVGRAPTLTQAQLRAEVATLKRDPGVVARRAAERDRQRLALAYRLILSVDRVDGPAHEILEDIRRRVEELQARDPASGGAPRPTSGRWLTDGVVPAGGAM